MHQYTFCIIFNDISRIYYSLQIFLLIGIRESYNALTLIGTGVFILVSKYININIKVLYINN